MPAPLKKVEELQVLKHLRNIKGIFLIKATSWEMERIFNSQPSSTHPVSAAVIQGLENLP